MFESITNFFKKFGKNDKENSSIAAKERLHLVLAQDRANISVDFLEMMKQEIIDVIKKYIDIDEKAIDVRMTNKAKDDGVIGSPALYANIPIVTIKNEARKLEGAIISRNQDIQEKDINNQLETKEIMQENTSENNIETKEIFNTNIEKKEKNNKEVEKEKKENSQGDILKESIDSTTNKVNKTSNKKQVNKKSNKKDSNSKTKNKTKTKNSKK